VFDYYNLLSNISGKSNFFVQGDTITFSGSLSVPSKNEADLKFNEIDTEFFLFTAANALEAIECSYQ
jgi:hypothetical protein